MSQISLKSITGITSITTPTGVDNQFTVHTNNTNQAFKVDHAGNSHFNNNVNITGVSTASNFKTGTTDLHPLGLTAASADIDDFVSVGSNIQLGNAGVITATSFVGSGANLTGIDATSIKDTGGNVKIQAQASGAIHTGISTFTTTSHFKLPSGTTGERPGTAASGDFRYNSTVKSIEFYNGNEWVATSPAPSINSITGSIYNGLSSNLVINVLNVTSTMSVRYSNNSNGSVIATDTSPSISGSNLTATVPSAVYNTAAGTVIKIEVLSDTSVTSLNSILKTIIAAPTGGTITTSGNYRIHTFNSSGTFGLTFATDVEYLVVAGGAGGGVANGGGGGGGAGGYRTNVPGQTSGRNSSAESTLSLSVGNYTVTVGGGGAGNVHGGTSGNRGNAGSNSVFSSITSTGGGYGGGDASRPGGNGGSGGGASRDNQSEGTGTSGQGFDGGRAGSNAGGGGGGAGQSGSSGSASNQAGNAGNGLQSNITGSAVYRGGGGGGGSETPSNPSDGSGDGGAGGGGRGGAAGPVGLAPQAGTANTGGGGGASGDHNSGGNHNGQNGGSGVVIVRYQL